MGGLRSYVAADDRDARTHRGAGFREAWATYADTLSSEGLYALSVDVTRPSEELDAREAALKVARVEAEERLFDEARRAGINARAVASP